MNFDLRISILFAKAKDKDIMKEFPLSLSRRKSFCLRLKGIWLTALLLPTPLLAQNEGKKDGDKFKEIQELEQRLEKTATKMLRLANKVAAGIRSEIREYRKDIIECCPEVLVVRPGQRMNYLRFLS